VKRGDVVVIVAQGELGRPRPAVVVQADELGEATTTILVCPITSDLTETLPVRPIIEPAATNGLRLRSQIMTDKALALRRGRVRRVIGQIDARTRAALDAALLVVFGLLPR
jgi:mRNA interferase MazF